MGWTSFICKDCRLGGLTRGQPKRRPDQNPDSTEGDGLSFALDARVQDEQPRKKRRMEVGLSYHKDEVLHHFAGLIYNYFSLLTLYDS